MARTLKTTGLATRLVQLIGVDDDLTTIKEFKNNLTVANSGLSITGTVGTGNRTWNGHANTPYIDASAGRLNVLSSIPTVGDPCSIFVIFAETGSAVSAQYSGNGAGTGLQIDGNGSGTWALREAAGGSSLSVVLPSITATTAYSMAFIPRNTSQSISYYADEGSSASGSSFSYTPGITGFSLAGMHSIGGISGSGTFASKTILLGVTDDEITLTEFNDLIADPYGYLFDTAASPMNLGSSSLNTAVSFGFQASNFSFAVPRYWKIPTADSNGTVRRIVVLADDASSVIDKGSATATAGFYSILVGNQATALGTKRMIAYDNWDGNTSTTSIRGSHGIATVAE